MLKTFGYPAMGALAENMPGWRCGPMPVGCTSVKYTRHCFHRAATKSAPMKLNRFSRLPGLAFTEQHVGLVDAVDRPVGRHLGRR